MEQEKSKKVLIGVLIAIVVLLLCAVAYLLFGKDMLNGKTNDNSTTTTTTSTTTMKNINNNDNAGFEKLKGTWVNCDTDSTLVIIFKNENSKDFYVYGNRDDSSAYGGVITNLKYSNDKYEISYLYGTEDGDETDEIKDEIVDATNIDNNEIVVNNSIYKKLDDNIADDYYCSR